MLKPDERGGGGEKKEEEEGENRAEIDGGEGLEDLGVS